MTKPVLQFKTLTEDDIEIYREIRLEALERHPDIFVSSFTEEKKKDDEFFLNFIQNDKVIGCFRHGLLQGVIGYTFFKDKESGEHRARIWLFYIRKNYRGRGFARKLFSIALEEISHRVDKVVLETYSNNKKAIQFYKGFDFEVFKVIEDYVKIKGKYYDRFFMIKALR